MLPICVRPERVWRKLSSIQGIRANLVYIVSLAQSTVPPPYTSNCNISTEYSRLQLTFSLRHGLSDPLFTHFLIFLHICIFTFSISMRSQIKGSKTTILVAKPYKFKSQNIP